MDDDAQRVTVVITCSIQPDKLAFARRELEAVIKKVMTLEPACRGIHVHEDPKNPHRMLIVEHWDSEDVFTGPRMQQPHMQAFLKTAQTFLDGPAEFGFWHEVAVARDSVGTDRIGAANHDSQAHGQRRHRGGRPRRCHRVLH